MHNFKLGNNTLKLYLYLTQRNISSAKEMKKLHCYLSLCNQIFEHFILTTKGGNLSKKLSLEFSLTICGIGKITSLNQKYRNKKRPTDVLSFPLHHNFKNDAGGGLQRLCLGDIYICREVILAQASEFQISYYEELCHLFVHGFLHLLGYDHEISKKDAQEMLQKEGDLLNNIMGSKKWKNLLK